jgi:hypothetical protein
MTGMTEGEDRVWNLTYEETLKRGHSVDTATQAAWVAVMAYREANKEPEV